jgi:CDP-4-dehydro-6-deoxyglucose reductase
MAAQEVRCHVQSFKQLTPTVFELVFETDPRFEFKAGQFISCVIPGAGPGGRDLRRAYSIASAPQNSRVELCVKLVAGGPGTNYLYTLREGSSFKGLAPYGDFTYETPASRHVCFIATGTGIAPFRSMMLSTEFLASPPLSTTCLLGVSDESEVLYAEELGGLKVPGMRYVCAVSRPKGHWNGFKGRVTDYLRSLGDAYPWTQTDYYLCGNGAMIEEVKRLLADRGVDKTSIHQEVYYKPPKEAPKPQPQA